MSDVFVSYSRENKVFARRLIDRLVQENKESWVDWIGIPKTAPNWWTEIKTGIENADSFVFIMSPASMASVVCNLEVDYAIELGKRIIPIVYQEIETKEAFASIADYQPDKSMQERLEGQKPIVIATDNWERLGHINWIFFDTEDKFETAFEELVKAVDTDLDYVKAHTRYLTRAQEWQRNEGRSDLLLFGEEIDRAEVWLIKAQSISEEDVVNPKLLPVQREYIEKSRAEDTRRKRLVRSAQLSIAVLAIALIIGTIGAILIVSQTQQQVVDAQGTLTPIPQTLAFVEGQVTNAVAAQNDAEAQADVASTQVSVANEQLATATQALVTATRVAELEAEGQATLGSVSTLVAEVFVTVTEAAIDFEIANQLANTLLLDNNNPQLQLQTMSEMVELYPEKVLVYLSRGLVYSGHEQYLLAIEDFDRVIDFNPNFAEAYNNRGLAYFYVEDYEQAIIDYNQAIELENEFYIAHNNRGNAYAALENYQQAIADFDRAIELNPQYIEAYNNRGNAYAALENYQQAIADFDRAIELNPQYIEAYNNRGLVYRDVTDYQQAIADFDRAIQLNPQYIEAYFNRGLVYRDVTDYQQAIADFDRAIQLNPQFIEAYYSRGLAYGSLGEYEKALDDFSEAVSSGYTEAYLFRGLTQYNLENYQAALSDFETYESLGGVIPENWVELKDEAQRIVDESE